MRSISQEPFADADQIADWALDSVQFVQAAGLVRGIANICIA